MLTKNSSITQSSNFNLKTEYVELIGASRTFEHIFMTIEELEAIRTKRDPIPASKHGLERICGASCETGAQ